MDTYQLTQTGPSVQAILDLVEADGVQYGKVLTKTDSGLPTWEIGTTVIDGKTWSGSTTLQTIFDALTYSEGYEKSGLVDFGMTTIQNKTVELGICSVTGYVTSTPYIGLDIISPRYQLHWFSSTVSGATATMNDMTITKLDKLVNIIDGTSWTDSTTLRTIIDALPATKTGLINFGSLHELGECFVYARTVASSNTYEISITGARNKLEWISTSITVDNATIGDMTVGKTAMVASGIALTGNTTLKTLSNLLPAYNDGVKSGLVDFGTIQINSTTYKIGMCLVVVDVPGGNNCFVYISNSRYRLYNSTALNIETNTINDLTFQNLNNLATVIDGTSWTTSTKLETIVNALTLKDSTWSGIVNFGSLSISSNTTCIGLAIVEAQNIYSNYYTITIISPTHRFSWSSTTIPINTATLGDMTIQTWSEWRKYLFEDAPFVNIDSLNPKTISDICNIVFGTDVLSDIGERTCYLRSNVVFSGTTYYGPTIIALRNVAANIWQLEITILNNQQTIMFARSTQSTSWSKRDSAIIERLFNGAFRTWQNNTRTGLPLSQLENLSLSNSNLFYIKIGFYFADGQWPDVAMNIIVSGQLLASGNVVNCPVMLMGDNEQYIQGYSAKVYWYNSRLFLVLADGSNTYQDFSIVSVEVIGHSF